MQGYEYFQKGHDYRTKHDIENALDCLNKAIELDASNAKYYNERGLIYYVAEESDKAIADFTKAISLKNKYAEAYLNLGRAFFQRENVDKAIENCSMAIKIAPRFDLAYDIRGQMKYALGKIDDAIADFTESINCAQSRFEGLDVDFLWSPMSYVLRAEAYNAKGEYQNALNDLNLVLKHDDKNAHAFYLRGTANIGLAKNNEALQDLNYAIPLYDANKDSEEIADCQDLIKQIQKTKALGNKDLENLMKQHKQGESIMSMKERQQFFVDYLKEEGYVPKIDESGDIEFKFEGDYYWIELEEDDEDYFRLYTAGDWGCKNDEEKIKLLKAASEASAQIKFVKVFVRGDDTVFTSVEVILNNRDDFKTNFERWLSVLQGGLDALRESMNSEDKAEDEK
jgi:tetratricopeptide (TPR) repeat protein